VSDEGRLVRRLNELRSVGLPVRGVTRMPHQASELWLAAQRGILSMRTSTLVDQSIRRYDAGRHDSTGRRNVGDCYIIGFGLLKFQQKYR